MRCSWLSTLSFSAALALPGCADLIDVPDHPQLAAQGPWRCLGAVQALQAIPATTATVRVQACDFISNCASVVSQLHAKLCAKRDIGCTNPLRADITDRAGLLEFQVPTGVSGFDGYLQVNAPSARCTDAAAFGTAGPMLCGLVPECDPSAPDDRCNIPTYAPSLLFFNPPVSADIERALQLPLLSSAGLPAVVQAAGAALDPTTGNLFITALDCDGNPAAGVTYGITQHQDEVTQLYVDSGVVSDTVLETDESGIGGFVGVPTGFAEVVGYNSDLQRIGEIGVQAAPFTMTYSALAPSP